MHISEGVLSPPVLIVGGILCLAGTALGLKKMKYDQVPKVAILTAAFFIGSLIHVPLGPSSVHLVLNGLVGILLGWCCFPAIVIGLLLQALFFQYGGIFVLGVNTFNMALPALTVYLVFFPLIKRQNHILWFLGAFLAGSLAVLGSGLFVALSLTTSGQAFVPAAKMVLLAHIPVMVIEGIITAVVLGFIEKVRPEMIYSSI